MRMPGLGELVIILAIVVLVFGASKLPQLGDGVGRAIKNFKRGLGSDDEHERTPAQRRELLDAHMRQLEAERARDDKVDEPRS